MARKDSIIDWPKKIAISSILVIILATLISAIIFVIIPAGSDIQAVGSVLGDTVGSVAGKAIGSFNALTKAPKTIDEGEKEGHSAKDTDVEIVQTHVNELGKLTVLKANVTVDNAMEYSTFKEVKAAELSVREGTLYFSVDFGKAEVAVNGETISVKIPEPQVTLTLGEETVLASYKEGSLIAPITQNADDGVESSANSRRQIFANAEEQLSTDANLRKRAQTAAKNQIEFLVKALRGEKCKVNVEFE